MKDILIYGAKYNIYREGKFLTVAEWVDDPNNGECFILERDIEGIGLVKEVFTNIDHWELISN